MNAEHERFRDWAAAYVLGSLDPHERSAYETHLDTCARCREDVHELAILPGLLRRVEPDRDVDLDAVDRVTRSAVARARDDYRAVDTSRRRWRALALASVAASIVLVVLLVFGGNPATTPVGRELAIEDGAEASGSVAIEERPWGTRIELDLAGLSPRPLYQLWAVDEGGSWTTAATWRATPQGVARLVGSAAVATDDLDRVVITSSDPTDVVLVAPA